MKNEESLRIEYSALFIKQLKQAPLEIKIAFKEARELFSDNPDNPALRNHALTEKFADFRSVDVTKDYRALFKIQVGKNQTVITFHILGTHIQLYG